MRFSAPDYFQVHQALKRKGVTLQLLWAEYVEVHGDKAYRYSRFCDHYRAWRDRQRRSMRQVHRAGEKLFIDYCGPTVPIINQATGEERRAQVFVAVLGASSYTYAEATWSQALPDWIASPEAAVLLVERWILARLRHHTFFTLASLNQAIRELLEDLNRRPFQGREESRRDLFQAIDRPVLRPLPETPYEYAEWRKAKPGIDYHLDLDKRLYSVPHSLVGQVLEVRLTHAMVEVFHKGHRVAAHPRHAPGRFSTLAEHMPKRHQAHRDWSPSRFLDWAKDIGVATLEMTQRQLQDRPHPEHGYRVSSDIRK